MPNNGKGKLSSENFGEVRLVGVSKVYEKDEERETVVEDCSLLIERGNSPF